MNDPVTLRPFRSGDEVGILDCYNRVFPRDGVIPERSLAHWTWKFPGNPAGLLTQIVAEHESEGIIGGYAGIPARIWSEGREQLAAQGVDLMVLPKWRRYGKRPGLFIHLGWKYHELYCGAEDGKVLFTYGWPVPAWRMGQRYLGYWNIRDWDFLFREVRAAQFKPRSAPGDLETKPVQRFAPDVDALFEQVKPSIGLCLLRDARYLNWRYADRPDRDYVLFECRDRGSGALRGICVYTVADFVYPNTGFFVDWLAPADDVAATTSMIAALEERAVADEVNVLAGVLNHVDPRFLQFQRHGFMLQGTPYFIVLASFKYDAMYYRDEWFFTMGDSDLV